MKLLSEDLQINILTYLDPLSLIKISITNKYLKNISENEWLIQQFPYVIINNKKILLKKVEWNLEVDILEELILHTDKLFKKNNPLLWCLTYNITYLFIESITNSIVLSIDKSSYQCNQFNSITNALSTILSNSYTSDFCNAVSVSSSAAVSLIGYGFWCNIWKPIHSYIQLNINFDAIKKIKKILFKLNLTNAIEICRYCYLLTKRYFLINLKKIIDICEPIISEKIPQYYNIKFELEINDNLFLKQFNRLFILSDI